ncbi:hypothetical protein [Saccharibacillus brassicae]|uniref:Uncharacterized protein n=1 Tax=Saccharibacillus brassicae TaxID=2583377 RepID=A0A4Y6UXY1_SACBS|nr:hypothetical protein [Saccharibacillus brassicae]QDH21994.1 hypothetical protein FFV09_14780 [Saccharibacillus brassicae]
MGRSRALHKFMVDTCDFQFDFMEIYKEWSLKAILKAVDTGQPLRDACFYLGLDTELIEQEVKIHALRQLYEEQSHFTVREIDLMTQYADHTLFGYEIGDLLEEMMFMDPRAWLGSFENSILYLNDQGIGAGAFPSSSELSDRQKEDAVNRLCAESLPLEFDAGLSTPERDAKLRWKWSEIGRRHGSGYRFFERFVRQDLLLRPHPNDIAKENRRERLREQHAYFRSVLHDLANGQKTARDLELYESKWSTYYLEFAAAYISHAATRSDDHEDDEDFDPALDKRKWAAIVKIASLFTLVKSHNLRRLLLRNLVQDVPFNFDEAAELIGVEYSDYKMNFLEPETVKEDRPALYMIILLTAEFALRPYLRDRLHEAGLYFGDKALDVTQEIEDGDEEELTVLKRRLIPLMLLRDLYSEEIQDVWNPESITAMFDDPLPDSEEIFLNLYKWTHKLNKANDEGKLFGAATREFLSYGSHRIMNTAVGLINGVEPFEQAFKKFVGIKPRDLDVADLEKMMDWL